MTISIRCAPRTQGNILANRERERGAVTVEGAIALCALMFVFAVILGGGDAILNQMRCTDAAGEAARFLARGQAEMAEEVLRQNAPADAKLRIGQTGRTITVTVSAQPMHGLLFGATVRAQAYAKLEPGVTSPIGRINA